MIVAGACGVGGAAPRRSMAPETAGSPGAAAAPSAPVAATSSTTVAPTTTTTTAVAGPPYPVSQLTRPFVDTSRPTVSNGVTISSSRALTTMVWLPQAPGRRPLVVFAHGFDVGPGTYASLLQAWAAHGYVVAAPEFPLTDPAVAGDHLDESDIDRQPADVRFVVDQLVSGPLAGRIDPARVAVAGHSDGGETVVGAGETPTPPGEPAYRAVVAMSAQVVPGTSGPYPPMLITQGDSDTINPPSLAYQLYDSAGPPKYLLTLRGAGHLPPLEAGSAWLPGIEAVTEAFLDAYDAGTAPVSAIPAAAAAYGNQSLQYVSG